MKKQITFFMLCFIIYAGLFFAAICEFRFYFIVDCYAWMLALSLFMLILGTLAKQGKIFLILFAVLCQFFAIILFFNQGDFYQIIKEPLSGRLYAVYVIDNKWFSSKGRIKYYEYDGFILHNPKISEYTDIDMSPPFFRVDSKGIYILCASAGPGVFFSEEYDYIFDLNQSSIQEFCIRKDSGDYAATYLITEDYIAYVTTKIQKELRVPLLPEQFREITDLIKSAKLSTYSGNEGERYFFDIKGENDTISFIYINGRQIFEKITKFLEIEEEI